MTVPESTSLVKRISDEVGEYGFRTVAAALSQVAYRKADAAKAAGYATEAVRWQVLARSVMLAAEVVPPFTVADKAEYAAEARTR